MHLNFPDVNQQCEFNNEMFKVTVIMKASGIRGSEVNIDQLIVRKLKLPNKSMLAWQKFSLIRTCTIPQSLVKLNLHLGTVEHT